MPIEFGNSGEHMGVGFDVAVFEMGCELIIIVVIVRIAIGELGENVHIFVSLLFEMALDAGNFSDKGLRFRFVTRERYKLT